MAGPPPAEKPPAPPAGLPPVEQPPAGQPPTKQPLTKQPPTKQPLTKQPPTKQPPTKQPPTKQPPTKQPLTKQPPTKQPPAKQSPAGPTPAEQLPAEEPPAEQPPAKQPPAGQPPAKQPPAKQSPAGPPPTEPEYPPAEHPPAAHPPAAHPPAGHPPAEHPPPEGRRRRFNGRRQRFNSKFRNVFKREAPEAESEPEIPEFTVAIVVLERLLHENSEFKYNFALGFQLRSGHVIRISGAKTTLMYIDRRPGFPLEEDDEGDWYEYDPRMIRHWSDNAMRFQKKFRTKRHQRRQLRYSKQNLDHAWAQIRAKKAADDAEERRQSEERRKAMAALSRETYHRKFWVEPITPLKWVPKEIRDPNLYPDDGSSEDLDPPSRAYDHSAQCVQLCWNYTEEDFMGYTPYVGQAGNVLATAAIARVKGMTMDEIQAIFAHTDTKSHDGGWKWVCDALTRLLLAVRASRGSGNSPTIQLPRRFDDIAEMGSTAMYWHWGAVLDFLDAEVMREVVPRVPQMVRPGLLVNFW